MRILVAYGSKHGATAEIAEAVGVKLSGGGFDVEVVEAGGVSHPAAADAVVIGSSVYMGQWAKSARRALARLARAQYQGPVWLFHSGPTGDKAGEPEPFPNKVNEAATSLDVKDRKTFAGKFDPADHRLIGKMAAGEAGDWRDWEEIDGWAGGIADSLAGTGAT